MDIGSMLNLFGIGFIALGLVFRFGPKKDWYWKLKNGAYGYIPLGIMLLINANLEKLFPNLPENVDTFILLGFLAIIVLLSRNAPDFLKPEWARWIEAQPMEIQEKMREAALADPNWTRHVASPEAVEKWADSLKNKRK